MCGSRCCFLPYASSTKPTLPIISETKRDEGSKDISESQRGRRVRKWRATSRLIDLSTSRLRPASNFELQTSNFLLPAASRLLLRERAVVLLDQVLVAGRHLFRAREVERVVACIDTLAEIPLELRELLERGRGELLQAARIERLAQVLRLVRQLPRVVPDVARITAREARPRVARGRAARRRGRARVAALRLAPVAARDATLRLPRLLAILL